jgi:hypothetical protein
MKLPVGCERKNGVIFCKTQGKEIEMKSCDWQLGQGSFCKGKSGFDYSFPDTIFKPDLNKKVDQKSYTIIKTMEKDKQRIDAYEKELYFAGHLSDIGDTGDKSVIANLFEPDTIVRRISVEKDFIFIDACDGEPPLKLPKDLEIYYEPWFMDRGSFVFVNPSGNEYPMGQQLKLATEGDIMRER